MIQLIFFCFPHDIVSLELLTGTSACIVWETNKVDAAEDIYACLCTLGKAALHQGEKYVHVDIHILEDSWGVAGREILAQDSEVVVQFHSCTFMCCHWWWGGCQTWN